MDTDCMVKVKSVSPAPERPEERSHTAMPVASALALASSGIYVATCPCRHVSLQSLTTASRSFFMERSLISPKNDDAEISIVMQGGGVDRGKQYEQKNVSVFLRFRVGIVVLFSCPLCSGESGV